MASRMYEVAQREEYSFGRFVGSWGGAAQLGWGLLNGQYADFMDGFVRVCGVRSLRDGRLFAFNGKVYEEVDEKELQGAYDKLLYKVGVTDRCPHADGFFRRNFLDKVRRYSRLEPRNDLWAFSNGVVDFRDGKLHRFSEDWHVLDYHPYAYNAEAKAPLFMRFLREVLPDKAQRDVLQMFLGLGLVHGYRRGRLSGACRGTVELCLLLLGSGANGKSTLFNVVSGLFGRAHISGLDYDTMTADGDEGMRGRAALRGMVFNWSTDSSPRKFGRKNTEMFKSLVSGEPYECRLIGGNLLKVDSGAPYLIFSMNQLPDFADDGSNGFLRRLQFVSFDVTIPKARRDPELANKIVSRELPGVFNWVYRGTRELRRRRFVFPDSGVNLRMKVRALLHGNPVVAWMAAYGLRPDALAPRELSVFVTTRELYECFVSFCEENDVVDIPTDRYFGKRMTSEGFVKRHTSAGNGYLCYGADLKALRVPMLVGDIEEPEESAGSDESVIKDD